MKRLLLVVLVLMLILSFTGTGLTAAKVTLRLAWWGNPTRDARTLEVIKLYMAKSPNVTIEPETTGWAGYWDKIATQAAANNLPDIMQQDYAYLNQFVSRNQLLDLTPYVRSRKLDLKGVDETFTSGGKVKNKLYGVSLGTNALSVGYDPAVLQKAGLSAPATNWTWADLEKMAATIHAKTGVLTLPFGTTDPRVVFENWIRQTGKSFYDKSGTKLGFTDPKPLVEYFEMQLRMLKAGLILKPETAYLTVTANEGPFAKGQVWMDYLWSNQIVMQAAANNRPIAIALLPRIAGSKRPGTFLKPSMFFSVMKSSQNKEEAIKFVDFFLNDIEANKILLAERGIPIVPAVRDTLKAMVDPVNRQVFDYISLVGNKNASAIDPADPNGAGEILALLRTVAQEVMYQKTSPENAAAKFMKDANAILAKNEPR